MTNETALRLPTGSGSAREISIMEFAGKIREIGQQIGFKVSSRGWCYLLEPLGLINKSQFDRVESLINECRTKGVLPIDFTAEEEARGFSGVETPDTENPEDSIKRFLKAAIEAEKYYTPDWWDGEEYYIQMVVEKIDLKTLFEPVCREYHIPIATTKGWSSMLQRAIYARRFKEAEERGLVGVLLDCGDHDPDGLRISEFLRSNLVDLGIITWRDGTEGYDPQDLLIERFGLNFDFIEANHLLWINDLITGSGKNLADPNHKNYHLPYIQQYLHTIGERKCEANALLMVRREDAEALCRQAIERYLGTDARERFARRRQGINERFEDYRERTGIGDAIQRVLDEAEEGGEE